MLKIKDGTNKKISEIDNSNTYLIMDFDRTITAGNSISTMGLVAKSNVLSHEYSKIRDRMYEFYRQIELDLEMDEAIRANFMREWVENHIFLYCHYGLSIDNINEMFKNKSLLIPRNGAIDFMKTMSELNIPVIIISGGIGDFIKMFLIENDCYNKNIIIISNFLTYKNGFVNGHSKSIIHSLNKNKIILDNSKYPSLKDRNKIVIIGDSTSDINMVPEPMREQALKIGFLDEKMENIPKYMAAFDIVGTDNTSFDEISYKVKKLKK